MSKQYQNQNDFKSAENESNDNDNNSESESKNENENSMLNNNMTEDEIKTLINQLNLSNGPSIVTQHNFNCNKNKSQKLKSEPHKFHDGKTTKKELFAELKQIGQEAKGLRDKTGCIAAYLGEAVAFTHRRTKMKEFTDIFSTQSKVWNVLKYLMEQVQCHLFTEPKYREVIFYEGLDSQTQQEFAKFDEFKVPLDIKQKKPNKELIEEYFIRVNKVLDKCIEFTLVNAKDEYYDHVIRAARTCWQWHDDLLKYIGKYCKWKDIFTKDKNVFLKPYWLSEFVDWLVYIWQITLEDVGCVVKIGITSKNGELFMFKNKKHQLPMNYLNYIDIIKQQKPKHNSRIEEVIQQFDKNTQKSAKVIALFGCGSKKTMAIYETILQQNIGILVSTSFQRLNIADGSTEFRKVSESDANKLKTLNDVQVTSWMDSFDPKIAQQLPGTR